MSESVLPHQIFLQRLKCSERRGQLQIIHAAMSARNATKRRWRQLNSSYALLDRTGPTRPNQRRVKADSGAPDEASRDTLAITPHRIRTCTRATKVRLSSLWISPVEWRSAQPRAARFQRTVRSLVRSHRQSNTAVWRQTRSCNSE